MTAEDILAVQYEIHAPAKIFLMFSGGHDSLVSTHLTAEWCKERILDFSVVHINTGIGIEQTREFVRSTCLEQGWPLIELHAEREEQTYEYIVCKYGFPSPTGHKYMYRRLKERKIETLIREQKTGWWDRIFLVTGARRQESRRRMAHTHFQRRIGAQIWIAPLEYWSKADCNLYLEKKGLRRNEVVDLIHMSGECLCGSYARRDEMADLETWFPQEAERIHALERRVEEKGLASCVWGYAARFTSEVHPAQESLFSPLCVDCEGR